ncbi:hypothetical protein [Xenorhabdus bovienii]|uniref:hypothetical protein n=1 Tax=Xenorhabdus bovienii TaxID=40576 RepID=UPI003DA28FA7
MYKYSNDMGEIKNDRLLDLYNKQHKFKLDEPELLIKIESALSLSNADFDLPIIVLREGVLVAFCLAHLSYREKINGLGCLNFSNVISSGDVEALRFMFRQIFFVAEIKMLIQGKDSILYGPIHNSILIDRGCRTFAGEPFTYKMPDNNLELCDMLDKIGCQKEKDLIEIIYDYDSRDKLLISLDDDLLMRTPKVDYYSVDGKEIFKLRKELAEFYNSSWQENWGYSPITDVEMGIAAENINNIMGMIARKNGKIIDCTIMQFIVESSNKVGRAFLSGVLPEYRGTGLSIVLTSKLSKIAIENNIKRFSLSWMLEDNKIIIGTMQRFMQYGNSNTRHYRIYSLSQGMFEGNLL